MIDIITTAITVITALGGYKLIEFLFSGRKRRAEVSSQELDNEGKKIDNRQDEVQRLEERLRVRDEKIDALYLELRNEQAERIKLLEENSSLKVQAAYHRPMLCEIKKCSNRLPESDY